MSHQPITRANLDSVCAVVDVTGFHTSKGFRAREFAMENFFKAVSLELDPELHDILDRHRQLVELMTEVNDVHGLTFRPRNSSFSYKNLPVIIQTTFELSRTSSHLYMATTNKHLMDIMNQLSIPYLDLTILEFHIPKVNYFCNNHTALPFDVKKREGMYCSLRYVSHIYKILNDLPAEEMYSDFENLTF